MKTFATSKHLRLGSASVAGAFARGFKRAISVCQINQPSQNSAPLLRQTRWYEDCGQPGGVLA